MIGWIFSRWDAFDRWRDLKNLWPACKKHYGDDINAARYSFYCDLLDKQVWTDYFTDAEIKAFVEGCD